MKKIIVVFIAGLVSIGAYAAASKTPRVASIQPAHEGILVLDTHLGEHVKKGQLLFHEQAKLNELAALGAKSALHVAKSAYARDKKLAQTHIVSPEALEVTKDAYIQAYVDYNTALITCKNDYNYAPFEGVVTKINFYDGTTVSDAGEVMVVTETLNNS
ncbi:MAG: hypothetical protein GY756_21665 [bacterium]|nr:hypothetical protein [bacterium]